MNIENNLETFVRLWQKLVRTRRVLLQQNKRFCIRRILQAWLPLWASDRRIASICQKSEQCGYDFLPPPAIEPLLHREFLRAFVSEYLDIGMRAVNLKALDKAYSEVFPHSPPINAAKKKIIGQYAKNATIRQKPPCEML